MTLVSEKKNKWSKVARKIRRAIFMHESSYYDMYENKGEKFFGRLYLHEIFRILKEQGIQKPLKILDAGCQTGRLSVPLAKEGHQITGVDTSQLALKRAAQHAADGGISVKLVHANLGAWLPKQPSGSFDAVLCTEVLYLRSNHKQLLSELLRVLKPGGLCFISHRPEAYYLVEASGRDDSEAMKIILTAKEGTLFGSYYNWQTREDLDTLYREMGVEPLAITAIGFLSWLKVNPENLSPGEQDSLFEVDTNPEYRNNSGGRYLLVSGRKNEQQNKTF